MRLRLLAIDLDGTLLDPGGRVSPAARAAVERARGAGLEVVACTGRRFRTALPVLHDLGLDGRVVVNNGAVVKEVASGRTLHHHYLPRDLFAPALATMRSAGVPLVYVDRFESGTDILPQQGPSVHRFQVDYVEDHHEHIAFVPDLSASAGDDVIMLSMMADSETLEALCAHAGSTLGDRVASHLIFNKNYEGFILELFSPLSGKWAGLSRVAEDLGLDASEIAAVGDDVNDAELLRRAGLGIAMGNAVPAVRDAADLVVAGNDQEGVVQAIERVLERA